MSHCFTRLTYYELLDLSPAAEPKEIQAAYLRLRDIFEGKSLAAYSLFSEKERKEILSRVEEAYHILSDQKAREEYDRALAGKTPPPFPLKPLLPLEEQKPSSTPSSPRVSAESKEEKNLAEPKPTKDFPHPTPSEKADSPKAASGKKVETEPASEPPGKQQPLPQSSAQTSAPKPEEKAFPQAQSPGVQKPNARVHPEMFEETIPDLPEKIPGPACGRPRPAVSGMLLRQAREEKGISIEQAWNLTRIRKPILTAIEEENYSELPAAVFLKGMLKIYARLLELEDPEAAAEAYLARMKAKTEQEES